MIMAEKTFFTREFEVDKCEKPLLLYQHAVGDVSCVVWDASLVLASYLQKLDSENEGYFKDRKVLELGAGVGCVGLTAAFLGADAVLTDLPEVIPLLERNISANNDLWKSRGNATALPLKWENHEGTIVEKLDFLLLADCVYYSEVSLFRPFPFYHLFYKPVARLINFLFNGFALVCAQSVPALVATMRKVCNSDTDVLISQERRSSEKQRAIWSEFVELLCESFTLRQIPFSEQHPRYSCNDILIFKCKLK